MKYHTILSNRYWLGTLWTWSIHFTYNKYPFKDHVFYTTVSIDKAVLHIKLQLFWMVIPGDMVVCILTKKACVQVTGCIFGSNDLILSETISLMVLLNY